KRKSKRPKSRKWHKTKYFERPFYFPHTSPAETKIPWLNWKLKYPKYRKRQSPKLLPNHLQSPERSGKLSVKAESGCLINTKPQAQMRCRSPLGFPSHDELRHLDSVKNK